MHAGFNLNIEDVDLSEHVKHGQEIHSENKNLVRSDLEKLADAKGVLEADKIIENWFPAVNAQIFLSHSHKDEELVIGLAGWLEKKFKLRSFIDSTVWGYADELLKEIDDRNCKNNDKKNGTYNYALRNRSTSHVHMMLSTALMDMIDRCECIIFVNTKNSFSPVDYFHGKGQTESPWIYAEITMTRILRRKSPKEHRPRSVTAATESYDKAPELRVRYPTDLLHLTPLTIADLNAWSRLAPERNPYLALDQLYKIKRLGNE